MPDEWLLFPGSHHSSSAAQCSAAEASVPLEELQKAGVFITISSFSKYNLPTVCMSCVMSIMGPHGYLSLSLSSLSSSASALSTV